MTSKSCAARVIVIRILLSPGAIIMMFGLDRSRKTSVHSSSTWVTRRQRWLLLSITTFLLLPSIDQDDLP
ncbi:hypothetical protein EDD16DRAFT_1556444 [Pisolithus croceorrhizus]|nr:hypothetical protein EV401DRAFT_1987453 [Pisolithus croceorrhizus]KAI6125857.1 hypothetical protein EDD16DRAFT_1556444 [Pisolithus croceorrhizus]KAI6154416.1 hypothetical protein EDD17DRAFT_1631696 [Pisolithus thermaeus]